jgi:hypothetical protein
MELTSYKIYFLKYFSDQLIFFLTKIQQALQSFLFSKCIFPFRSIIAFYFLKLETLACRIFSSVFQCLTFQR